jgi:hypothetical protein
VSEQTIKEQIMALRDALRLEAAARERLGVLCALDNDPAAERRAEEESEATHRALASEALCHLPAVLDHLERVERERDLARKEAGEVHGGYIHNWVEPQAETMRAALASDGSKAAEVLNAAEVWEPTHCGTCDAGATERLRAAVRAWRAEGGRG